jgi:hypothetical protein
MLPCPYIGISAHTAPSPPAQTHVLPTQAAQYTRVHLQVCQSGQGAPLLGQRSKQVLVVQVPAGGQGSHVTRRDACLARHGLS